MNFRDSTNSASESYRTTPDPDVTISLTADSTIVDGGLSFAANTATLAIVEDTVLVLPLTFTFSFWIKPTATAVSGSIFGLID